MAVFDLYKRFSNDDDDDAHLSARVGADSRLPPCEFQGPSGWAEDVFTAELAL